MERQGSQGAPAVIAVGPMLDRVLEATADLDVTVLYATTVMPFDGWTLRDTGASEVVLVEPYLIGTSASEVSGALHDRPHRLLSLGVRNMELKSTGHRKITFAHTGSMLAACETAFPDSFR